LKANRLESSHLTQEERWEAVKYAVVATVLIAVGAMFGFFGWIAVWEAEAVVAAGIVVIAFIYGYIGALEDERSSK
jgi:Na+-transporting NADH:ubiquinone oxidoreductase subunit NqrB